MNRGRVSMLSTFASCHADGFRTTAVRVAERGGIRIALEPGKAFGAPRPGRFRGGDWGLRLGTSRRGRDRTVVFGSLRALSQCVGIQMRIVDGPR